MIDFMPLPLVQSPVLLAVYEVSYTSYPAPCSTLDRAAHPDSLMVIRNRRHMTYTANLRLC